MSTSEGEQLTNSTAVASSSQIFSTFFSQTVQCDRVTNALLSYIKTMRLMKEASRHVSRAMMGLCPADWPANDQLKTCLEDQGEVLGLAEGLIRSLFPRFKKHSQIIKDTQALLTDLEGKIRENRAMHSQFEEMKIKSRITRQQEEQIRFMLRDTDRALEVISGSVAERLHGMDLSACDLVRDILLKFEEVQKIIATENLQIIDIISDLTKTLPKPKPRFLNLTDAESMKIIEDFKKNTVQLEETQKIMAENKSQKVQSDKPTIKDRIQTRGSGKSVTAVIEEQLDEQLSDEHFSDTEGRWAEEETRQAAHQQVAYDRDPMITHEKQTTSTSRVYELETEVGESTKRKSKKHQPKGFYGYRSTL